ncbi:hypothetical protein WA171_000833 [Blastocystis sp. BT1]
MDWPTISSHSVRDEINSITIPSRTILSSGIDELDLEESIKKQIQQFVESIQQYHLVQDTLPGIKSLFLLRYFHYLETAINSFPQNSSCTNDFVNSMRMEQIRSLIQSIKISPSTGSRTNQQFTERIKACRTARESCIEVLNEMRINHVNMSFPIDRDELSTIPIPSASQIQKDLQRESFILNGTVFSGALGISHIRSSLASACSSIADEESIDATVERVMEMISRTRVGEYCYNELLKVLPVGDASLILKVDNQNTIPIELQINSNIYEVKGEMKWGLVVSSFFGFNYSIIDINDVTNQKEVIMNIKLSFHSYNCFGMAEYSGCDLEDSGMVSISFD